MNETRLKMKIHDLVDKRDKILEEIEDSKQYLSPNSLEIVQDLNELIQAYQDLLEELTND